MQASHPIGIFDSGFGGLTVFKSIKERLPQYDYLYLGDNARAPYGPRPADEVRYLMGFNERILTDRRDHIYVFDIASKKTTQITRGPYDDRSAVWSPDGNSLAFVSNRTKEPDANVNTDIFLVPAAGGESIARTSACRMRGYVPQRQIFVMLALMSASLGAGMRPRNSTAAMRHSWIPRSHRASTSATSPG